MAVKASESVLAVAAVSFEEALEAHLQCKVGECAHEIAACLSTP
jgi:hypothetical protein